MAGIPPLATVLSVQKLYAVLDSSEMNIDALQAVALRLALPILQDSTARLRRDDCSAGSTVMAPPSGAAAEVPLSSASHNKYGAPPLRDASAPSLHSATDDTDETAASTIMRVLALATALIRLSDEHKAESRPPEAHRYAELAVHIIEALQLDAVWPPQPLTRRRLFPTASHADDSDTNGDTMLMYTVRLAASVLLHECEIPGALLASLGVTSHEVEEARLLIATAENARRLAPTLEPGTQGGCTVHKHSGRHAAAVRVRARGQPRRAPTLLHCGDTSMHAVFRHCGIPCRISLPFPDTGPSVPSSISHCHRVLGSSLLLRAYATIGGLWLAWGSADDAMRVVRAANQVESNWRANVMMRPVATAARASSTTAKHAPTSTTDAGGRQQQHADHWLAPVWDTFGGMDDITDAIHALRRQCLLTPSGDAGAIDPSESLERELMMAAAEDSAVLDSKKAEDKEKQAAVIDEVLSARRRRKMELKEVQRGQGKKACDEDKSGGHPTPTENALELEANCCPETVSVAHNVVNRTRETESSRRLAHETYDDKDNNLSQQHKKRSDSATSTPELNPSQFVDPTSPLQENGTRLPPGRPSSSTHGQCAAFTGLMPRPRWYGRTAAASIIARQWSPGEASSVNPPPLREKSRGAVAIASTTSAGSARVPTVTDVVHGAWEDRNDMDMSLGVLYTAAAQLRQSQSEGAGTASFSHRALRCRLRALLPAALRCQIRHDEAKKVERDRHGDDVTTDAASTAITPAGIAVGDYDDDDAITDLGEWVSLALSLAGYYVQQRDLSHAKHCLAVTATILSAVPLASTFRTRRRPPPGPEGPGIPTESSSSSGAAEEAGTIEESAVAGEPTDNNELLYFLTTEYHTVALKLAVATYEQMEATRQIAAGNTSKSTTAAAQTTRKTATKTEEPKTIVKAFWNVLCVPEEQVNEGMAARLGYNGESSSSESSSSQGSSPASSAGSTPGLGGSTGMIDWATEPTRIPLLEPEYARALWHTVEQRRINEAQQKRVEGRNAGIEEKEGGVVGEDGAPKKKRHARAVAQGGSRGALLQSNDTVEFSTAMSNILPHGLQYPPQYFTYEEGIRGILGEHVTPALAAADLCARTVTLDTNCELWLKIGRCRAEVFGIVFRATDDLAMGKRRMDTLRQLLEAPLHKQVFRNVLRQGELDYGNTAMRIAGILRDKLGPAGCQVHCERYYEDAATHFRAFGDGFRKEIEQAQRELGNKQLAVLEGNDLPSYIVGEMCLAEALLKQKKYEGVRQCYQGLKDFLATQPQDGAWKSNPVVVEQLQVADEMLELLRERAKLAATTSLAGKGKT